MKLVLTLTSVLLFVACSGCGDSQESLTKETNSTMKEVVAVLDDIKDADSAKANKAKLKSLLERVNDIHDRQGKLAMPSESEGKAILDKYGTEMEQTRKKFIAHMTRIGLDPEIRPVLDDLATTMRKAR